MISRTQLGYSALGACSVAIGLVNLILTLHMLGVSGESDVWLLALAVVAACAFLSQLGVDQFQIFYEHERARGASHARVFARGACEWAILSGIAFALLVAAVSPLIVQLFASGLPAIVKATATSIVLAMAAQIAAIPLTHVVRQYLNAQGRYILSYLIGLWSALVMAMLLLFAYLASCPVSSLAWMVGAGGAIQMVFCIALVWPELGQHASLKLTWRQLRPFVLASVAMRSGHALNNFFSALIINSTLSSLSLGGISIFQYASRFAAAAASIAVGPQAAILNAQISRGWAEADQPAVTKAATDFVKHVMPILVAVVAVVWFLLPTIIEILVPQKMSIDDLVLTFLILSCWYGIIQLECVFVAIIIAAQRASFFIAVNGLFVIVFFLFSRITLADLNVLAGLTAVAAVTNLAPWQHASLPLAATAAQLVSISLYAGLAKLMMRTHFGTIPSTRPSVV